LTLVISGKASAQVIVGQVARQMVIEAGIDLVAEGRQGQLWAIQPKAHGPLIGLRSAT
jgi:hypothetical protein